MACVLVGLFLHAHSVGIRSDFVAPSEERGWDPDGLAGWLVGWLVGWFGDNNVPVTVSRRRGVSVTWLDTL